jgi:hypothetical protein
MKTNIFLASVLLLAGCNAAPTAPSALNGTVAPLEVQRALNLADYSGNTFFDTMTMEDGIKENLDTDYATEYVVADSETVLAAMDSFSDKVGRNVLKPFRTEGIDGFKELVDELAGESYTPATVKAAISERGLVPWTIADFLTMASGASTIVHLDDNNYYYNVSYEPDEVKSGRSFGAGPLHKADDASYPFYLGELTEFLDSSEDPLPFYEQIFAVITQSDSSTLAEVDESAQTLLTDFVTIYTAELYRHVIAGLGGRAPWENDLAEATMISLWSSQVGKVQLEGEIIEGTPRDWNGFGPNGSGVGITRRDRRSLQTKVCNAVRELSPTTVSGFERYLDEAKPDCYRSIMEFINNEETQEAVGENAKRLSKAVVRFLKYTQDHAAEIDEQIAAE